MTYTFLIRYLAMSTLPTDPRRQAVPSLTGCAYQAWISIVMWLELKDETDALYLVCAEDVDVVRKDNAVAVLPSETTNDSGMNVHTVLPPDLCKYSARSIQRRLSGRFIEYSQIQLARFHPTRSIFKRDPFIPSVYQSCDCSFLSISSCRLTFGRRRQ